MASYLNCVGVTIAALAQVSGCERDASLDRLRLAGEIAQVELSFREQILATRSGHVLNTIRYTYYTKKK